MPPTRAESDRRADKIYLLTAIATESNGQKIAKAHGRAATMRFFKNLITFCSFFPFYFV